MSITRKDFLMKLGGISMVPAVAETVLSSGNIKAIAFDGLAIFNPGPVFALAEALFPGKGEQLSNSWKVKLFEYQWLLALADKYQDFTTITENALVYAANAVKVDMTIDKRKQLVNAFFNLKVWPDVLSVLSALKQQGMKLVLLSNMTDKMLRDNIKGNQLEGLFEEVFSTDANQTYKPSPASYRIAMDKLHLKKSEIAFVAFAGWDASGSKLFGYTTCWVNRLNQPNEELGVTSDWTGNTLTGMLKFFS